MIRVSVLYPRKDGARFDWSYYTGTHLPLVARRLASAVKSVSIDQGLASGAPGSPATYEAIAHFTFESVPAFQAAFAPHAQEIMGDVPNYSSVEPIVQISEIRAGA